MDNTTNLSPNCLAILNDVRPVAEALPIGTIIEALDLYDEDLRQLLSGSERRAIGMCISKLVAQGLLPLEHAGFNSSRHNIYRRV